MDPEKNIDEVVDTFEGGDEVSVDDFIKQLEEKEKTCTSPLKRR